MAGSSAMSKGSTPPFALHEARLGHLGPLRGRVLSGLPLTTEEREFIAMALEQLDGKRGKAELRRVEKARIAEYVEALVEEEGLLTEPAVAKVMKEYGRKRSTVYAAMKMHESKKPK